MKILVIIVVGFFFVTAPTNAQNSESSKFGNGIFNTVAKDSTFSFKMGLQMQFQGFSEWENRDNKLSDAGSGFLVRRARLKFDGFIYSPKLTYKLILGLANNDISGASIYTSNAPRYILDAVVKWNFYENFELWFGQTKLPGNREHITSSGSLQFVDRSLLNTRYNIDRDLGIQLRHRSKLSEHVILKESFAVSQGEGRNVTSGNLGGFQYTSRLELFPFGDFKKNGAYIGGDLYRESTPKLAIGATYDFNHDAVKTRSNQGSYMLTDLGLHETNISTFYLDAIFKYQGFSFMTEYAKRNADAPQPKNADGSLAADAVQIGSGLNVQLGYLFQSDWELSGRFTSVDASQRLSDKFPQHQYTLGVSKYIVGHNLKVQSDVSYLTTSDQKEGLLWRIQFQVDF